MDKYHEVERLTDTEREDTLGFLIQGGTKNKIIELFMSHLCC